MASLLLVAVFGAAVQAVALESTIARPTDASIPYATVQLPSKVTEPPSPSLVRELLRRADVQTVLVGPDNTCGYVSGLIGAAYTCGDPNGYCAFLTTANVGYVACCDDSDCGFRADCYDAAQIENGDCNNGCMNDIYTAKCTASSAPYCGTIRFQGSITDFFCHSLSYSTVMDASTTYIGESDGRSFSELVVTLTSSSAGSGSTATGSSDGLDFGSSSTTGGSSGGTASGSSSRSSSSSTAAAGAGGKSSSSSSNIGPIVGGVVGGVAVIALVILGVWLIMRRNRRRDQNQQMAPQHPGAAPSAYPPMQQSPPPFAPGAPQDTGYSQQPYHDGAVMHQYNDKPQNWSTTSQQQVVTPYPPPPQPQQGYPHQQQGAGGVWYSPNNQEKPPGTESYATSPSSGSPLSSSSPLDPRMSMAQPPSSPASTERLSAFQPQYTGGSTFQGQGQGQGQPTVPSTVYESGGDAVGTQGQHANHHGQFHELGSN